jgi:hypothetical protein
VGHEVVKIGLNEWAIANRWSTGAHDAAPLSFAEKRDKRQFSKVSKVRLVTSGLSGCIAVGLLSEDKFSLMHVFSDCSKTNWDQYQEQMAKCATMMGGPITSAFVGYSDEVDLKNDAYNLVSQWAATVTTEVDSRLVGGAVVMSPATDRVSFNAAKLDDYKDAKAVVDAGTFVQHSGPLQEQQVQESKQ